MEAKATTTSLLPRQQQQQQQHDQQASSSGEAGRSRKKRVSWGYVHPLNEDGELEEESFRITVDNTPQRLPPPMDSDGSVSADAGRPKKQAIMSVEADGPPPPIADNAEAAVHIAPPKTTMRRLLSFFHASPSSPQGKEDIRQVL